MAPRTIFDSPASRAAVAPWRPIGDDAPDAPPERKVEAQPRLGRSAVGYLEAREGIDGKAYFNSCASCESFIPEAMMRGVVRGDRCAKFSSTFPVTDDSTCNSYVPWPSGTPCGQCVEHAAEKVIKGQRGSLSPFDVNFTFDTKKRCETCKFLEGTSCALLAAMSAEMPAVFDMNAEVKPIAKCDLWTDYPPPEEYGP